MMRALFILAAIGMSMPLVASSHSIQRPDSQIAKSGFEDALNDYGTLQWKCPAVTYERKNADGTYDRWGMCAVEIGNNVVYRNEGAIVPLGTLLTREERPPKTFKSYSSDVTFTSDSIHYLTYHERHDSSQIIVGYDVTFLACAATYAFTIYIRDKTQDGALEALDYVLETVKPTTYCEL